MKVAVITGAARRIGACMATCFHRAGYAVMIHAHHSRQEASELCQQLNDNRSGSAEVFFADLRLADTPAALIDATLKWKGQLDVLIHNASLFIREENLSTLTSETLYAVNVRAPHQLSLAAFPHLSRQRGCIINITDIHAHSPLSGYETYCETKAALTMQMLALAKAFAPTVRVNAVAPGAIAWPEGANSLSLQVKATILQATPLGCHGQPQDIADTALFLAQHRFITGQVIKVDGGRSLVSQPLLQ